MTGASYQIISRDCCQDARAVISCFLLDHDVEPTVGDQAPYMSIFQPGHAYLAITINNSHHHIHFIL